MDYTVQSGDCMSSIAFGNGFFWQTLWNLSQNADLKALRKNPNVLMAGDIVYIPDLRVKKVAGAAGARHTFKLKGVPEKLNITLLDYKQQPRPGLEYVITIDGTSSRGATDGAGKITHPIPPNAKAGKLTFAAPPLLDLKGNPIPGKPRKQVLNLLLGNLNPITEISGIKARLANLGFYKGTLDEDQNDDLASALTAFQGTQKLPLTGLADGATIQKLQDLHGH